MKANQIKGYEFPTLAMWPKPWYLTKRWQIWAYKLLPDGRLKWYRHYTETTGRSRIVVFDTLEEATIFATEENLQLIKTIETLALSSDIKKSLRLKVEKEITNKSRLSNEEQLMLQEAIRRNKKQPPVDITALVLPSNHEPLRQQLYLQLSETPYIRYAHLTKDIHPIILKRENHVDWSTRIIANEKSAETVYRDMIAYGYGLSGATHWGKTKAAIRKLLLPRANELLQLASVKRMLDAALSKGQKALIVGNFVFWFEGRSNADWIVLEASESEHSKKGNTLWKEGTILSKNHGRIVVLPYIKENGEYVQGHTKNAPGDGSAKPRHPSEYVEVPFEVLEDDLMLGLFGELNYE